MMYSDTDIRKALESGSLKIEPLNNRLLRASGLVLRLSPTLLQPQPGTVVDVHRGIVPEFKPIELTMENPYEIQPGGFLLGSTFEKVTVGSSLGFLIEGRSTLARVGLTVVQTAMMVYPGHRNRGVTLELSNNGPCPILLYPKMKIARAALFELKSPGTISYDDNGKYREQKLVGPPVFDEEILEEDLKE